MNAIFVGGCARSGTTMLGSMLSASPSAFTTPESHFKEVLFKEEISIEKAEQYLNNNFRLKLWGLENVSLKGQTSMVEVMNNILSLYKQKNDITNDKSVWVDHTPPQFEMFNALAKNFPEAKFIHIIRDSRAVAASVFPLDWGPSNPVEFSEWWLKKVAYGFSAELIHPDRVIRVRFEDILNNTEETLKFICKQTGLVYSDKMLSGNKDFLPKYTHNQHSLIGSSADTSRAERWKTQLTPREIEIIETMTGEVLVNMGYRISTKKAKIKLTKAEALKYKFLSFFSNKVVNKIKHKKRRDKAVKQLKA